MTRDPAYILCGGRSSRMGEDKARVDIAGRAMVARVAQQLAPVSCGIFLVAQEAGRYDDLGLTTLGDRIPGLGPLGGLSTALHHRLGLSGPGWLTLTACDTLMRKPEGLDLLTAGAGTHRAVAWRGEYWHPMPGRYHTDILTIVDQLLSEDRRAFQGLLHHEGVEALAIMCDVTGGPATFNLNTPHDVDAARKMFDHG